MSFPRYEAYKDSGVEWLKEVPAHWEVGPVKGVATCNDEVLSESTSGDFELVYVEISGVCAGAGISETMATTFENAPSRARRRVKDGDVIVSTVRTYLRAVTPIENPPDNLIASTGFAVIRPRSIASRYLGYLFQGEFLISEVIARSVGVSYPAINASELMRLRIPIPTAAEQTTIAAFLDRETAKIDDLVAEQRNLIALLKEKRQALISHAVTKGLDAGAPMMDSGVEWLGEVPAHWEMTRLRVLFRQEKRQDQVGKSVLSVYRDYGVIRKESRDDNMNKTPEDLSGYQLVNPNDLVVNKMKAWQGSLGVSDFEGITSPDYVVFSPRHRECPAFLHLLLRCSRMVSVYRSVSNGIRPAQWRLEPDQFLRLPVFLPPVHEQRDLVSFITERTSRFEILSGEAEATIALLQERRTALISAAVTGKIDVRGLANPALAPELESA